MEGEGVKKKRFDRDFKISTVKMVTQEGHKALRGSQELRDIPKSTLQLEKEV